METPPPAAAPAEEPKSSAVLMIEELYAKRHEIKTLMIGTIDTDNSADAAWSKPVNASGLSHLLRMLNVKLDRYYHRGMYPPTTAQPAGPVAGVKSNANAAKLSRKTRRLLEKAQKKVHKADLKAREQKIPDLIKGNSNGGR